MDRRIEEGRANRDPRNVITVGKPYMMVLPNLAMWLRGVTPSRHQDPSKAHVRAQLQKEELEEKANGYALSICAAKIGKHHDDC